MSKGGDQAAVIGYKQDILMKHNKDKILEINGTKISFLCVPGSFKTLWLLSLYPKKWVPEDGNQLVVII